MNALWKNLSRFIVSMRLTVALLAFAILLVFIATIEQVHMGIWAVQREYFRSLVALWRIPVSNTFTLVVPLPGGYLVGGLLFANLTATYFQRFKLSWSKAGLYLAHLGVVLLLVGEFFSGLWQEDFQMRLDEGQTSSYAESLRANELAFIDTSDPKNDSVVAIPESLLADGRTLQDPNLPFRVTVRAYYPNAILQERRRMENPPPALANQGIGPDAAVLPQEPSVRTGEPNTPAAVVELTGVKGSLGTWLVSTMLAQPQPFVCEGRTWLVVLRSERLYQPFSLTLLKFSHDRYAGTDIPKNFSSRVRLRSGDGKTDREALIYMNNPLRYGGLTFYQAGFDNNDRTTVLQVVRNPSWLLPYVACVMAALGLLVHFALTLTRFIGSRKKVPSH